MKSSLKWKKEKTLEEDGYIYTQMMCQGYGKCGSFSEYEQCELPVKQMSENIPEGARSYKNYVRETR